MFGPESHSEQARRKSPQPRVAIKQTQRQRQRFEIDFAKQSGLNNALVSLYLESLRPFCRRKAAHLNGFEGAVDE